MNAESADVTTTLLGFARTLRPAGVDATPDRVHAMLAAVAALDVTSREDTYWAGRLTLCSEPDDLPIYDAVFRSYFAGRGIGGGPAIPLAPVDRRPVALFAPEPARAADPDDETDPHTVAAVAGDSEVLRHRDLSAMSAAERAEVRRLIAALTPDAAARRTRRRRAARHGPVDPRRTVRRMLHRVGEPVEPARRRRGTRPRRLVLLLDISGSMAPYADSLLRFGHVACRRRPTLTEVFTIGTRLTRITRALRHRDPDAALWAASRAIPDWQGGTRLAESIKAFLDRWGQRGTARGAIVVIFSDGWERGEPDLLARQLQRLSRLSYRLVWVNPHRGKPGYAPLAAGMAAAVPYLDSFLAGHSLASLEDLVGVIARA